MGTSNKEGSNKTSSSSSTSEKSKKDIKLHATAKEFVPHTPVVRF